MKKIYYIVPVLFIMLFSSCDDFLTSELKSEYESTNFYTSEENAKMGVTAIYNTLYAHTSWMWVFGDVASDDAVKGGNPGDQADINFMDDFSAKSDNGIIATYWRAVYETIAQANNAIHYIPGMTINQAVREQLVAEAKFLRAYSYFNLVNVFGKVPLKTRPHLSQADIHVGLSDVAAIYSQIERDLTDAYPILQPSYVEKGRATRGAALGLLAKAQLYQQKYSACLQSIEALELLQQYDLLSSYENLYKRGSEDSVEVVFGIRYLNDAKATLGNSLTQWFASEPENGYYFNAPTQSFVDAFAEHTTDNEDDPRLDASIGREGKPWFNGTTFSSSWSSASGYLVKKYGEDNVTGFQIGESNMPYHYMRYADVLLMKAEAINELGEGAIAGAVSKAATELNRVRTRAKLNGTTAATQADMRKAIRAERRKELGFEFHRFYDLMRWGKEEAVAALGADFQWAEPRFYYPLPLGELDANQALK